jgi:hypothetical protein
LSRIDRRACAFQYKNPVISPSARVDFVHTRHTDECFPEWQIRSILLSALLSAYRRISLWHAVCKLILPDLHSKKSNAVASNFLACEFPLSITSKEKHDANS